jgi:transposase
MYKQITIKTLNEQGEKKSEIARMMGCHRNTVRNILGRDKYIEKQTRDKSSGFTPYKALIQEWLDGDISRRRIYEMLHETHKIENTYHALCKYVQKQFPKKAEAFGVQLHEPGEEAEIDFGELGRFPGPDGKLVRTFGLAVILPYSRLDFYAICYDQKLETLCTELENAFEYFGGVPKRLKVDNMKTAVLKNQHYDLTLNPDFMEFASHYGTVIIPCTPYSPEQKGTVEAGIKYLQINFIAGRTFQDSADLKKQLRNWVDNYANKRIHGTTKRVPAVVFESVEKDKLQPLPEEKFSFFNRGTRIVAPNCHIHFENNYYSVPAIHAGKEVTVRWNNHLVRIIFEGEQVALHQRVNGQGNYVTQRNHLPDYKVYSETEYQARYETKMSEIGSDAHQYFNMLLKTKESYWFRTVKAILGLCEKYDKEEVNKALKRALYYNATDILTIKHILEKKLYLLDTEPKLLHVVDTNIQENIFSRDLTYYTIQQ